MKKIALAITLSAISSTGLSQTDARFSVEALLGQANQTAEFDNFYLVSLYDPAIRLNEIDSDDTSTGIRFAYTFNDYFAIELGYHDYGTAEDDVKDIQSHGIPGYGVLSWNEKISGEFESKAINLGIKAMYPISEKFTLIGRLGASNWDSDFTIGYNYSEDYADYYDSMYDYSYRENYKESEDDSGTDAYYGLGIEYKINEQFFAAAEYTYTKYDAKFGILKIENEIENLSLSVGYRF